MKMMMMMMMMMMVINDGNDGDSSVRNNVMKLRKTTLHVVVPVHDLNI